MTTLILVMICTALAGCLMARYGLGIQELVLLTPIGMGIGALFQFFLLNILLHFLPVIFAVWLVSGAMLGVGVLLWYFKRRQVAPLQSSLSKTYILGLLILWIGLSVAISDANRHLGNVDEPEHGPRESVIGQAGLLPRLTSFHYINPNFCGYYHYAETAVIGVLSQQSGVLDLIKVTHVRVTYNVTAIIGLCFVFLWTLLKRQKTAWAVLGTLIFLTISPAEWVSTIHNIPAINQHLPDSAFFERSRVNAEYNNLNPFAGHLEIAKSNPNLMVSFISYTESPNPAGFWVVGLLALIACCYLKPERHGWYWYAGLGMLEAFGTLYYISGGILILLATGFYLLYQVWAAEAAQRKAAFLRVIVFSLLGLMTLVFQGGTITDNAFCTPPTEVFADSQQVQADEYSLLLVNDYFGYQGYVLSSQNLPPVKFTNPNDWLNILMDWGIGLILYPFLVLYLFLKRWHFPAFIALAGFLFVLQAFGLKNNMVPELNYRLAVLPIWIIGLFSVLWMQSFCQQPTRLRRWSSYAFIVVVTVGMCLGGVAQLISWLGQESASSIILTPLDEQVRAEWLGKLDPLKQRVFDPSLPPYRGQGRAIMTFGTFGSYQENPVIMTENLYPGFETWRDTLLPGDLRSAPYDYVYLNEFWLSDVTWYRYLNLANPAYYELVQQWQDEEGRERRLYRIVSDVNATPDFLAQNAATYGLSEEDFALYQSYSPAFELTSSTPVLNPATNSLAVDKSLALSTVGRYAQGSAAEGETREYWFSLMKVIEATQYQADIVDPNVQAALAEWQQTKSPEPLLEAGITYVAFDKEWLNSLTPEDYAALANSSFYEPITVWNLPNTKYSPAFYFLYRVVDSN